MNMIISALIIGSIFAISACKPQSAPSSAPSKAAAAPKRLDNTPPLHRDNIASVAMRSKDHTTLVAAIKAADYVTSIAASGPLTVFAPINTAFEKLPEGTVATLLKPENRPDLREILKYHVTTSAIQPSWFKDGQKLGMVNGKKAIVHVKDGKVTINNAKIIASIPATNGIIHVIDTVLLPPAK